MKRGLTLVLLLASTTLALPARASSLAPRGRPRCSMTSPAIMRRLISEPLNTEKFWADATHLLPHIEVAYTSLGIRDKDSSLHLGTFKQTSFALKPSFAMCGSEFHAFVEAGFGELDEETRHLVNGEHMNWLLAMRFGFEALVRPARIFGEELRLADAFAVGLGVSVGANAFSPMHVQEMLRPGSRLEVDEILEFGPRLVFDVTDWMAFTAALNIGVSSFEFLFAKREKEEERLLLGGSAVFGLQFSFPSHAAFHDDHSVHGH